jgi:hypothetical protein
MTRVKRDEQLAHALSFPSCGVGALKISAALRAIQSLRLGVFALKKEKWETESPELGGEGRFSSSPGERKFTNGCDQFFPRQEFPDPTKTTCGQ